VKSALLAADVCAVCEFGTVTNRVCDFCKATFFHSYQAKSLSGRNGEKGAPGVQGGRSAVPGRKEAA